MNDTQPSLTEPETPGAPHKADAPADAPGVASGDASGDQAIVTEPPRKSPWSTKAKVVRAFWAITMATAWRIAPGPGSRAALLRLFGARIAPGVRIHRSVSIEIPWHLDIGTGTVVCKGAILYCLGRVTIGRACLIGPYAHLCAGTHDYTDPRFTLLREPITIGDRCVLMTDSFVAPSVTLADGTVLRPRCGAYRDTQPDTVYSGNPGKPIDPGGHA